MVKEESAYHRIGGASGIRLLTRRFYELMDQRPDAAACRAIHPPSLVKSEEKLFEYLSGWLGGPPLFTDKHGAPMLRRRHLPAAIGSDESHGWLACFNQAWSETVADQTLGDVILPKLETLGIHMQNR
jgi:hemoglobin